MLNRVESVFAAVMMVALTGCQRPAKPLPAAPGGARFRDARLKILEGGTHPIFGDGDLRVADGIWLPESSDPARALIFPEQAQITCMSSEKTCRELTVPLGLTGEIVEVMDIEEKIWQIDSWDARGLLASYAPDSSASARASDRCHHHVLTMTFDSGAVSASDIPTRDKGCEAFTETNSYRLTRGNYYVDTTPGNDMDRRK